MRTMRFFRQRDYVILGLVVVALSCAETTGPGAAAPRITSVSPDAVAAGAGETILTVTGSRFVERSVVFVSGAAVPTAFGSSTQLTATVPASALSAPGSVPVSVFTSAPGGGTSSALTLTRNNLAPDVTALVNDTVTVGTPSRPMTVQGSGFSSASVVEIAGSPRETTFLNGTTLNFLATAPDLQNAGTREVRVRNPAPAGVSDSVLIKVLDLVPELDPPLALGLHVGTGPFTMRLDGRNFGADVQVEWNGVLRATTSVSPTRLEIPVSGADVSAPGNVSIRVIAPPNAIQPTRASQAVALTIRSVGATTRTLAEIPRPGLTDLVWNEATSRFYASIGGAGGALAGTVSSFTSSGVFDDSVHTADIPVQLAVSQPATYLYVGVWSPFRVDRLTITPFALDQSITVPAFPVALVALPGSPQSVLVSLGNVSRAGSAVAIYDNGVRRGNLLLLARDELSYLAVTDPSGGVVFGTDAWSSENSYFRFGTGPAGPTIAQSVSQTFQLIEPKTAGRYLAYAGGIFDPVTRTKAREYPWLSGAAFVHDSLTGRYFVLREGSIGIYDMHSATLLGSIVIPGTGFDGFGDWAELVRWGTHGLAYFTVNHMVILESAAVAP